MLADQYRVSHDLWEKGLRELNAHGLVTTKLRKELAFGSSHRVRRAKIDWDRLREGPPKPSTVKRKSMPKKKAAPVLRDFD